MPNTPADTEKRRQQPLSSRQGTNGARGQNGSRWPGDRRAGGRHFAAEPHKQVISYHLVEPSLEYWKNQGSEVIARYYEETQAEFDYIVEDYRIQANAAATLYKSYLASYRCWRFWIIIATGMLAAINVCATLSLLSEVPPLWGTTKVTVPALLSGVAALYAASLTVAGNVESFYNRAEDAGRFREMRDLLLSRYREYSSKWLSYVVAYGKTPTACINAGQLYRQLVDSDHELRQKIKEWQVQGPKGGKPSPGGQR
jgi:hypothetical protein